MREVLSEAVRSISDFACSTAHDGRAAWRLIRAEEPEVVIADWRMPGLDGMQLCRRIRAHEGTGYTYVILLTAFSGTETRLEAMRVGADDFLTKPYQLAELQASLLGAERVVAVHRRRAESEREARTNADRLERFIEATSDAIIAIDRERRIMAWNRGAELMFGWRRDEVLGKVSPTVPPELEGEVLQFRRAILEDGETLPNFRTIRLTRDGRRIAVLGTYAPLRDGDGRVVGVVATVKDLSVHEELEER